PGLVDFNFWLGQLQTRGRAFVATGIETSGEARAQLVRGWYFTYLDRAPLFGEERPFVNMLLGGVPEVTVLSRILGSTEYVSRTPIIVGGSAPLTNATLITALFRQILDRDPTPDELQAREGQLNSQPPSAV